MDLEALIVSTLGFTPSLILSDVILKFIAENGIPQPFKLLIIYPEQNPTPIELSTAISNLRNQFKYYLSLNVIKSELKLYSVPFENIEITTLNLMDIVFENMSFLENSSDYFNGKPLNIFFNLSGGMNFLILAVYTVALYFPTKLIFTFVENTNQILRYEPPNLIYKLTRDDLEILTTLSKSKFGLTLKQVFGNLKELGIIKDRTTLFRHTKKLRNLNLVQTKEFNKRNIIFRITNHGQFLIKASRLFPHHYCGL